MAQYEEFLRALLAPLGVYDMAADSIGGGELAALGAALDGAADALAFAEREALTATAETVGLDRREALFARRPAAPTTELRREAIACLTRIGGDSLTPSAIAATLGGCGIRARAQEAGPGRLRVTFPGTAGEPEGYDRIRRILLDILPCHLETEFYLRYLTWAECAAAGWTWGAAEAAGHTFRSFSLAVPEEA